MNNPVMNYDPTGHFTILALLIGFGISVAFEIIEDALDGELFTDDSHDWKDYLDAGISGVLGSMSGGKAMQFGLSVAGGMIDAWISGDIEENGFFNSLLYVGLSTGISLGISVVANKIASRVKASSLLKMSNNVANRKLGSMGIMMKIGSKAANNIGGLSKILSNKSNLISNIVAENVAGSIFGGVSSMVYGHLSDLFGFYF